MPFVSSSCWKLVFQHLHMHLQELQHSQYPETKGILLLTLPLKYPLLWYTEELCLIQLEQTGGKCTQSAKKSSNELGELGPFSPSCLKFWIWRTHTLCTSSAAERGDIVGSNGKGDRAGAWAHGIPNFSTTIWLMMASTPAKASTPFVNYVI